MRATIQMRKYENVNRNLQSYANSKKQWAKYSEKCNNLKLILRTKYPVHQEHTKKKPYPTISLHT